jgi:uncharacterized RDD family membrane protein YckC
MISDVQRASVFKRISAGIFDFIITSTLIVAITLLLSAILGYDGYKTRLDGFYAKYEEQFEIKFDMTEEERAAMTDDDRKRYDEAYEALISDSDAMYTYNMIISLTLLITSIGILFGILITEFILPLIFGNGQTLGKKIFGVGLMRTDGVKVSTVMMFVRAILGKYTLETMIPVLIVLMLIFNMIGIEGTVVLGGILLLQLILICATKNRTLVHDLLAYTVAVDVASQRIFESPEALLEYKKRIHAEQAERSTY